ncbi:MAG: flagellar hook-length control protein FliK [Spirochaetes bacterium]|nr:flagellar hook-length control protein FliK [Spirochaetota bacterium]
MIDRLLSSNILQEAQELLKVQNKHNNKNEFGISFDEMFAVKKENNIMDLKKTDHSESYNDVEIHLYYNDDIKENKTNTISEKNNEENNYSDKGKIELSNKEKDKAVVSEKKELKEAVNGKEKEIKETQNDKKNETVNFLHFYSLKFKELNVDIRQKIDNVINNFKKGRISENLANSMILNILKNSKTENIDKIKNLKIVFKDMSASKDINKQKPDIVKNDLNNDPIKNTNNEKSNLILNSDKIKNNKKEHLTDIKKNLLKNSENEKTESNVKNIKNDFVLNVNGLKANDNIGRNRTIEPQKVLEQNRDSMFSQIAKNTKVILTQGQTTFSTMIRPENFGRIDFKFIIKDGKVDGKMIFQNQETADFFKSNIQELKAVFQKANVEMGNVDLIMAGTRFADNQSGQNKEHNENFDSEDNQLKIKNSYSMNINSFEENINLNNSNYSNISESKVNLVI